MGSFQHRLWQRSRSESPSRMAICGCCVTLNARHSCGCSVVAPAALRSHSLRQIEHCWSFLKHSLRQSTCVRATADPITRTVYARGTHRSAQRLAHSSKQVASAPGHSVSQFALQAAQWSKTSLHSVSPLCHCWKKQRVARLTGSTIAVHCASGVGPARKCVRWHSDCGSWAYSPLQNGSFWHSASHSC